MPQFTGLKLSQDVSTVAVRPDIHRVQIVDTKSNDLLYETPGLIGGGGNSGFQTLNIVAQFGAAKIVLVGFDMRVDKGVHWHGRHSAGLNNPMDSNMVRWRKALNGAAIVLAKLGITAINASESSALTAFPKMSLDEAMQC